jgi:hypothetical protein
MHVSSGKVRLLNVFFGQADEVVTTLQSRVAPRNAPDSLWNIAFILRNSLEKKNRKEERKRKKL